MSQIFDRFRRIYEYGSPERVLFGVDAGKQVGVEAKRLDVGKNCLIMTDPGVKKAGLAIKVQETLATEGFEVEIYDKVLPEPTLKSAEEAANYTRKTKVDFVVGVGGGSSLDTAKIVGRAITNPGDLRRYLPIKEPPENWSAPGVPVIAIPTTAGTGAEITKEAVVIISEEKVKGWIDHARPKVAIVDPLMSSAMPPKLTASTGIDALCHAVESALSKISFPLTLALALESIRLISSNIRRATFQGDNLEARYNMALATLTEAFSEANCGDVEAHASGSITGPFYRIPHGIACGIALPYVMEYNLPVNMNMLVRIADSMGEDVKGLSAREAAYRGIYAVRRLLEDTGLPSTLSEIEGYNRKDIPELVKLFLTNPWIIRGFHGQFRRIATTESITKLFENQFNGTLGKP